MSGKIKHTLRSENRPDLTPMIDVVFLLLIYFMVTTQLIKEEADLSLRLPSAPPDVNVDYLVSEHVIDILDDGQVLLNGSPKDSPFDSEIPELRVTLQRLAQSDRQMEIDTIITIQADPESMHQRSIDVLNACAAAGVTLVSFAAQS